ncbi:MAG: sugar kinase [Promethearchaeia archaeon]
MTNGKILIQKRYKKIMPPEMICLGELLVEIMRPEVDTPHNRIGEVYRGPYPSGAPAIFIDSAARMGRQFDISTGYIGVIGNDEFGETIIHKLEKDGVDTSQIRREEDLHTGIAFNQYNSDGSRKFIFAAGAAGETSQDDINPSYFKDVKNLHIMGSALSISDSSKEACYNAIKIAREQNPEVVISFDPNLRPGMLDLETILKICKPVLEVADILLPSGEEAEMLAGNTGEVKACQELLKMHPKLVVLKQGERGCTVFSDDKADGIHIPGYKVEEIDPTGAGDSFGGAFMVGYLLDWKIEKIARFANAVGALKVQVFGPMPNTEYQAVIALMNEN